MYELAYFLGPNGKQEVLRRDYSFGYSIRQAKIIDPRRYNEWYPHPGYAWAMRREVFNAIGGLLDFCIVGSGDLHFAFALLGRIEETVPPNMHQDYKTLALRWGNQVAQIAEFGEKVGYAPVNLWHFWHGTRDNRNYVDRWYKFIFVSLHNHECFQSSLNHFDFLNFVMCFLLFPGLF